MHNYFKCLKTLLFFNSNMHHNDIEANDLLFLETLFIENYPVQNFSVYMKEDVKKLLVDSFGKDYLDVYIHNVLYNTFCFSKVEQISHNNSSCDLYTVIRLKDKLFKVDYSYRSHEGLNTGDILNNLKEVNKKENVIAYYEGVQKS